MAQTHKTRIGPTQYMNFDEEGYKAWKAAGGREYREGGETVADPNAAPDSPAMVADDERSEADGDGGSVTVTRKKAPAKKAGS